MTQTPRQPEPLENRGANFEIMLAELRQLKIDSDARFNGLQTEIQRVIDRLFNQQNEN